MSDDARGRAKVWFNGGPWDDSELDGLFAYMIADHAPPFICMKVGGRFEHYVKYGDCPEHDICFEYAGRCRDRKPHEPCGHNHEHEA